MTRLKILGLSGALVTAALVGGTLISAVSANPTGTSSSPGNGTVATASQSPGAYCQTYRDKLAQNLGVDVSALTPAAKEAARATIDEAVANGDLPAAIANQIKQRIDNATGDGCALLGARWRAALKSAVQRGIGQDLLQAAARTLKLQPAELRSRLAGGASLRQIAKDQGVDVDVLSSAIHDAAKADLDKLVIAGRITAAREGQILDRLDQALRDGKLFNGAGLSLRRGPGPLAPVASSSAAS